MTAILLLENLKPDDLITASKAAHETKGSSLNLLEGERITAHDMLYALMLRSANDGCVAVAERIAGSESRFAAMMNKKAQEIGATSTRFINCNGLNCDGHVTTARDLAKMARYASRYPEFNAATRAKTYVIQRSSDKRDTLLKNHDKFLWHFPGVDGIKTGWTVPAGRCFVGSATWNGWRLISVVMNSPNWEAETAALMKYGFSRYERVQVAQAGQSFGKTGVQNGQPATVEAILRDPLYAVKPRGADSSVDLRPGLKTVYAPLKRGAEVGILQAFCNSRVVGVSSLVAAAPVAKSTVIAAKAGGSKWYYGFAALIGVIGIGYGRGPLAKAARIR